MTGTTAGELANIAMPRSRGAPYFAIPMRLAPSV